MKHPYLWATYINKNTWNGTLGAYGEEIKNNGE